MQVAQECLLWCRPVQDYYKYSRDFVKIIQCEINEPKENPTHLLYLQNKDKLLEEFVWLGCALFSYSFFCPCTCATQQKNIELNINKKTKTSLKRAGSERRMKAPERSKIIKKMRGSKMPCLMEYKGCKFSGLLFQCSSFCTQTEGFFGGDFLRLIFNN